MKLSEKAFHYLGIIATAASLCMYISYIPQIIDNLHGFKSNPTQPLAAAINCLLWVFYGLLREKKDWPIAIANSPGVIFGFIAFLTAL
ncbi:SemiSWEET family transporter [Gilliamella apicola]|uniref:SemiSWEET family transporter n=2 Tax=Gilliamella apicola TaxID=1196095 RepID=UPI000D781A51|nr:SemiSWEET family transporter [Gilliamella apicola]PXY99083.1 ABC transporter permease [Gilliamella apicola]WLS92689.1 SemiSWEET family transporter [Gilliamella apicola]